mmetsp:Transcript_15727/g.36114  ORF Transcript_15727/g.36114 Transcript_15727/m.36114 type:complete len:142 (-) Transcript_15727:574-999(-)
MEPSHTMVEYFFCHKPRSSSAHGPSSPTPNPTIAVTKSNQANNGRYSLSLVHLSVVTELLHPNRSTEPAVLIPQRAHRETKLRPLFDKLVEKSLVEIISDRVINESFLGFGFPFGLISKHHIIVPTTFHPSRRGRLIPRGQ